MEKQDKYIISIYFTLIILVIVGFITMSSSGTEKQWEQPINNIELVGTRNEIYYMIDNYKLESWKVTKNYCNVEHPVLIKYDRISSKSYLVPVMTLINSISNTVDTYELKLPYNYKIN